MRTPVSQSKNVVLINDWLANLSSLKRGKITQIVFRPANANKCLCIQIRDALTSLLTANLRNYNLRLQQALSYLTQHSTWSFTEKLFFIENQPRSFGRSKTCTRSWNSDKIREPSAMASQLWRHACLCHASLRRKLTPTTAKHRYYQPVMCNIVSRRPTTRDLHSWFAFDLRRFCLCAERSWQLASGADGHKSIPQHPPACSSY